MLPSAYVRMKYIIRYIRELCYVYKDSLIAFLYTNDEILRIDFFINEFPF